ncbi:MAG: hypothetical protein KatS3mg014_2703 [Actinomycetota bacterium]|nr:MAG: hypothetical protein KatS3mg014_2703 [Actinomycetota bacterium]
MTDIDALLGRIDLDDVRRRLDAALRPVRRLRPTGRAFLAKDDATFVGEEIVAGLSDEERDALFEELGHGDILERLLPERSSELTCENPSSMASGTWGFGSFVLGPRGYFFEEPDSDFLSEYPYRLLGAWEPADSEAAYEAAWVEVHVAWWDRLGFPPYRGECASGPEHLLLRALERIIGKDDEAWANGIRWSLEDKAYPTLEELIDLTSRGRERPREAVEAVLRAAAEGRVAEEVPARLRRRILREAYLATW